MKDPFVFFGERSRQHGPVFKTRLLGSNLIAFVGPEAFTFFCDERYFTRRDATPPHMQELLHPDAAPFIDGPAQKKRRQLLMHAFTPAALGGYRPIVERVVDRYLRRFVEAGEVRGVDELGAMCFALASALFAGANPDEDDPHRARVFDQMVAGVFALPVKLPFTAYGKALRARDELRAFVRSAVEGYQPGSATHVLQRLVEARTADGGAMSTEEIRIEVLHFFAAAYAGLQAALCNLVIALAQNPSVMDRARAEATAGTSGFPYIDQVTREVRRYYKLVPTTFFARVKEDCEFRGFRIPKGWKATAALHATMNDGQTFPHPERFDPDRFSPERAEHQRAPNSYVPHGGGPMDGHRCAGEALADLVLITFASRALRDTTWELPEQDLTPKLGGLCPLPAGGLRVRFRRA
jgi:cytochrome P450